MPALDSGELIFPAAKSKIAACAVGMPRNCVAGTADVKVSHFSCLDWGVFRQQLDAQIEGFFQLLLPFFKAIRVAVVVVIVLSRPD